MILPKASSQKIFMESSDVVQSFLLLLLYLFLFFFILLLVYPRNLHTFLILTENMQI